MIPRSLFRPLQIVARKVRLLIVSLSVLLLVSVVGIGYLISSKSSDQHLIQASEITPAAAPRKQVAIARSSYSFDEIAVLFQALVEKELFTAKGIYVVAWDTNRHVFYDLYNQHADTAYNAASMTKLVTALSLAKQAQANDFIQADTEAVSSEGGSLPATLYRQKDLFAALLIQSSNQAAYTLAKLHGSSPNFIKSMNAEGDRIGLSHSIFRDPAGLDFGSKSSASYMSPRDVARASFELASRFPELAKLSSHYNYNILDRDGTTHTLRNTNPLVKTTPNVLLSKTGYTRLAGGNMTMLIEPEPGVWVSIVVAKSTLADRVSDMQKLVNAVDRTFTVYDSLQDIKLAKYP